MKIETPAWVRKSVFYQIFPDRFAIGKGVPTPSNLESWEAPPTFHGFKGGNLYGVIEKLDYLVELGINAIYLNPIFKSTANHRYHTYDFYEVDPMLGGNEAFEKLLKEAHGRGVKVIIDGVFNHASRGFFQFNHTLENGRASPFIDWFHFNHDWLESGRELKAYPNSDEFSGDEAKKPDIDKIGYRAWWGLPALPKFNVSNKAVQDYILDIARFWIRFGADGWRLDVPEEIDNPEFWREFRRVVKEENPEAYIVGEIWQEAQSWLEGDKFDAVMNYVLGRAVMGYFLGDQLDRELVGRCGYGDVAPLGLIDFSRELQRVLELYPKEINEVQFNLMTSHDTPRLLNLARGNEKRVKLAFSFLLTFVGAPCFYYGDEIGMDGGHDPQCRKGFLWDERKWNTGILNHMKRFISLRKSRKSLQSGDFNLLETKSSALVYTRFFEGETTLVAFNTTDEKVTVELSCPKGLQQPKCFWNESRLKIENGRINLEMQPCSVSVLI